ncbi:unnamed protein product [Phytophthora fragariaefolia]|uniref:Unnamed protein product n=1 Tax=Phytophthora fragariaefolia TaxID=1490495 RepID=A0A9W6Y3D5_9STRA|nr:unnamed protein product [Phytophthora fragariaefolia]
MDAGAVGARSDIGGTTRRVRLSEIHIILHRSFYNVGIHTGRGERAKVDVTSPETSAVAMASRVGKPPRSPWLRWVDLRHSSTPIRLTGNPREVTNGYTDTVGSKYTSASTSGAGTTSTVFITAEYKSSETVGMRLRYASLTACYSTCTGTTQRASRRFPRKSEMPAEKDDEPS